MAALREAIRLKPDYAPAHLSLGVALATKGRLDEAIAAYREAIRLRPNDAESHFRLGQALFEVGFLDDAVAAYREATRLDPDAADPHCNLAQCLRDLGRFREALAENRLCHEIGSRRPGWRYPSEQWVADGQQLVEGEEDLEAQLEVHVSAGTQPENAGELVALARVAMNQGRPSLAARWYQAAFAQSPGFADAIAAGHRRLAARAAVLSSIGGTESAPRASTTRRARPGARRRSRGSRQTWPASRGVGREPSDRPSGSEGPGAAHAKPGLGVGAHDGRAGETPRKRARTLVEALGGHR